MQLLEYYLRDPGAEAGLLGHGVELSLGQPGGQALEQGLVSVDDAWLTGLGQIAREERLVPTPASVVVHRGGVRSCLLIYNALRRAYRNPKHH